jgi:purine-nucleoside/S-methyl-5'-thioadenosine phosphorylase / adenosine deaminase
MEWKEGSGVRFLEATLPGARAVFTTRTGGVSSGPFASLNLGILTGDEREAVMENRGRAARAAGTEPESVLIGRQVHGAEVERRDEAPAPNPFAEGSGNPSEVDGQATGALGLTPIVLVADCLPVALSGRDGVAMVHCGWRGLAGGIVARGVKEVAATAAAVGPGVGPCCYEVGEEVLAEFAGLGEGIADGRMLDLREVARRLLAAEGVHEIDSTDLCTSCNRDLFFSHRRDHGETGRQAGMVMRCRD